MTSTTITLLVLSIGLGLTWWRFKPPADADKEPLSQEALNRILKLESHKGEEP